MTRTDDIINVASHRLSTGALEEVLASHPDVAECAVLGVADAIKGEIPLGLIVLKAGVRRFPRRDRKRGGPDGARKDRRRGFFQGRDGRQAAAQDALGQDSARSIKKIADGVDYQVPPTIDDPLILDEITADLSVLGYPAGSARNSV